MAGKYSSSNQTNSQNQSEPINNNSEDYNKIINNIPEPKEMDEEVNRLQDVIDDFEQNYGSSDYWEPILNEDGTKSDTQLVHENNLRRVVDSIKEAQYQLESASDSYKYLQNEDLSDGWIADTSSQSAEILTRRAQGSFEKYLQAEKDALYAINVFNSFAEDNPSYYGDLGDTLQPYNNIAFYYDEGIGKSTFSDYK